MQYLLCTATGCKILLPKHRILFMVDIILFLFRPTLGGTINSTGFLFQFSPINIFIVEDCEWYHYIDCQAQNFNIKRFFEFRFFFRGVTEV